MATRARLAAVVAAVWVIRGVTPHADERDVELSVHIRDRTALPEAQLDRATSIAAGIYRRAGVQIVWVAPGTETTATLTIVIESTVATSGVRRQQDAMGVAPSPGDGTRGTIAYVFYDRVVEFAKPGRLEPTVVLGCAIAHELGHLLLPVNAHTRDGIMRAAWDPSFIPRSGVPVPGFAPDEARLLRLRAASRSANR